MTRPANKETWVGPKRVANPAMIIRSAPLPRNVFLLGYSLEVVGPRITQNVALVRLLPLSSCDVLSVLSFESSEHWSSVARSFIEA